MVEISSGIKTSHVFMQTHKVRKNVNANAKMSVISLILSFYFRIWLGNEKTNKQTLIGSTLDQEIPFKFMDFGTTAEKSSSAVFAPAAVACTNVCVIL